ncbi:hypothetical protein KAR10_01925, partial [bacterium]|nr:hypothetical protein [bacterium]
KATLKADAAKGEAGKGEGAKAEPAKPEPKSFGDKVTDYASYVAKNPVAFTQNVFAYLSGMKFMQMGMARLKKYAQTRNDKAFEKLAGEQLLRKTAKNQAEIAASEAKTTRMVNSEPMSTGRYNPLRAANRGLDRVFKNRPVNRLIKEMGKRAEMEAQQAKLAQRMSDMRATADKIIQSTPPLDVVRQVAESMGKYGKDVLKAESTGRDLIEAKARFNDATRSRKTTARDIQVLENQGNKAAIEVIRANEARGRAVAELQNGRGGIHAETVLRKFETQSAEKITKNELEVQTAGTKVEALTKTKNNQEAMQKPAETRAARDQLMEKRAATSNQRQKNRLSRRIKACESKISELEKRLEPLEKASSELQQLETARENILKEITYLGRQAGVAERLVSSRGSVEPIVTLMESMAFKSQVEIFKSVESQKATEIMRAMSFEGLSEYGRQLSWKEVTQQADALIKGKNYQVAGDLLAWRAEIFKGKPGERMIDKPDYAKALEQSSSSVMQDYARLNSKKVVPGSVIETLKDFKKFLEAREQLSLETALKQFNMKNSESGRSYLDARQLKLTDRNSVDACLDTLITPQSKAARTKILEATHQLAHMDARIDRARSLGREAEAMELEKQYAKVEKEINRLETKVGEEYTALPNTKTVIKNTKILRTESAKDLALEMSEFMQKKPGESEATYTKRLQKEGHLKDADMTEAFITTWRKTYKSIFKAEFQGKPQKIAQYRATIEAYRKGINKVLGAKKGEPGYQLLDGKSMHARFIQLRDQMIKDGKLKAGSIAEARFNRVYGEIVFTRVTGYKGMRLAQKVMLSEFFGGNNVGLKAGGGKTNVFIMFPGLARMMTGKALRSEILVDDAAAINKYITERQKATGLVQGELAKAFGVELKNGMKLYEAGKQNGYVELIEALRNPNQVVILDHTSRAHLRNAEVSNPALRSALREANLVGIDEVHMAATSQTSAIIGGKVSAPDVKLVRQVDNMLTKLGFDYAYYKNYNTKGEVKLGNGFKVETGLRMQSMYDPRVAKQVETAANSPDRIITLTKDGPKLNGEAGKALRQFTDVEIEATLKTLYSRQGKAGEYNSYIIEGKKIYPVDQLGGIQRQQISNDIVGQITAARINGLDPHTAVRVSETSMQTPLSAMYAGNHNARIVGASGTVTGIENLMKNKIGSDTTHISTSKLDAQTMIYETGVGKRKGEILTSLSSGDSVVYHTIEHKQAGHKKALVFEADPVTQIELVQQYTGRLKANKPVIGIMNVESTGYYVPKGTGRSFIETYKLNAKIDAPPRGGEVIGYEYIRITKEGIQTIVENANKIDNQIMIINEQGATGKNYQAHMTLVVRNGHALTSDVLTQLLLRTGRSGKSSTESWDTTRYVCVEAREMFNTVETAKGRLSEIRELAKVDTTADHALIKLLESYQKIKAENITPRDLLEINAKYRQMELIGDSTRFSVQD